MNTFALNTLLLVSLPIFALAFDINSKTNVAIYWGQNSAGSQDRLSTYCESSDADIVLLSFLYEFPKLGLNFANACSDTFSNGLLHCSKIAEDIATCQSLGKKVLLSLGGASGAYGFTDDSEAEDFAQILWDTFGEGTGASERPFDTTIVDGFDFDIENNNNVGYAALVTRLRTLFESGTKDYYISAAPQCPYPDASVGNLLENADVDFAFIQFYNNYCNVDKTFNWDTWVEYANSIAPNSDIKLYLGLPGSATAAGSGYISDMDSLASIVQDISTSSNFGGISLWDASQAFSNVLNGESYAANIKNVLESNVQDSTTSSSSAVGPVTTTSSGVTTSSSSSSSTTTTTATSSSSSSSKTTLVPTTSIEETFVVSTSKVTSTLYPASSQVHYQTTVTTTDDVVITQTTTICPETMSSTTTAAVTTTSTTPTATGDSAHASAVALNAQYSSGQMNGLAGCTDGEIACTADGNYAVCNYGSWVSMECAAGTTCYAYDSNGAVFTGCNFSYLKSNFV